MSFSVIFVLSLHEKNNEKQVLRYHFIAKSSQQTTTTNTRCYCTQLCNIWESDVWTVKKRESQQLLDDKRCPSIDNSSSTGSQSFSIWRCCYSWWDPEKQHSWRHVQTMRMSRRWDLFHHNISWSVFCWHLPFSNTNRQTLLQVLENLYLVWL